MGYDHEPQNYQVCLHVGPVPPELSGAMCIDITPASLDVAAMVEALSSANIDASDLRARTVVAITADAPLALLAYTAASAFAGRRIDAIVNGSFIDVAALSAAGTRLHTARPDTVIDHLVVGAPHETLPYVTLDAPLHELQATQVRWAKRLWFVPADNAAIALSQYIVILALRQRPSGDRYPLLAASGFPAPTPEGPTAGAVADLEELRNAALTARRSVRSGERDALADFAQPTVRQAWLAAAAATPIEETLQRLGASHNPETDLWHCPRPSRHRNNDATASMKIQTDRDKTTKVRCFRCDAERVDSLRLVMDALDLSVDEAARWLFSDSTVTLETVY